MHETKQVAFMSLEYAPGGTLNDLQRKSIKQRKHLGDEQVSKIIRCILLGLRAMHKADYVHRDLKPSNIVITKDGEPKLIDFGLAVKGAARQGIEDVCGTLAYQAPEQMAGGQLYGKAVDLWAVGLIMFELISARHPLWTGGIDKKQYREKAQGFTNKDFKFKSRRFTDLSRNLITKLCNSKPSLRYTVDQALQHPWITRDFGGG
jgi:serine/threonine protein kinase